MMPDDDFGQGDLAAWLLEQQSALGRRIRAMPKGNRDRAIARMLRNIHGNIEIGHQYRQRKAQLFRRRL